MEKACQNVPAAGNFAAFSQFLAAYSTLDFTSSTLAGKGAWHLLPTTPAMLPTATEHFDRAGGDAEVQRQPKSHTFTVILTMAALTKVALETMKRCVGDAIQI